LNKFSNGMIQLGEQQRAYRIQGRVFLVGCPRSGTTLLQSFLAAHPQIYSLRETDFFPVLFPSRRLLKIAGLASPRVKHHLVSLLEEPNRADLKTQLPKLGLFANQYTRAFINVLDTLALEQGTPIWLEKTPRHLHFVDYIEKHVPQVRFIHLIRDGVDQVASGYDLERKYGRWKEAPEPQTQEELLERLDGNISRWIRDVQLSYKYCSRKNHTLVEYEALLDATTDTLKDLCHFLQIEYSDQMIVERQKVAQELTPDDKAGFYNVRNNLYDPGHAKFYNLFNEEVRQYILERVSPLRDKKRWNRPV